MGQLDRIRHTTAYFTFLQGWKIVPSGVFLLAMGLYAGLRAPGPLAARDFGLWYGGTVLALVGYWLAWRSYRARFGEVRPSAQMRQRTLRVIGVCALLVLVLSWMLGRLRPGPLAVGGWGFAAVAIGLVLYWAWAERVLHHYLAAAAGMAVLALVELLAGSPSAALFGVPTAQGVAADALFAAGALVLAVGLLDHGVLVRSLPPLPEDEGTR